MYSPLIKKVIAKACNVSVDECVEVQRLKLELQRLTQENKELKQQTERYQAENQELQEKLGQLRVQLATLSEHSTPVTSSSLSANLISPRESSTTVVLVDSPDSQVKADEGKPVELLNQLPNGMWHIKLNSGVQVIVKPEALKVLA
jgi:regulator of replication initiation timing